MTSRQLGHGDASRVTSTTSQLLYVQDSRLVLKDSIFSNNVVNATKGGLITYTGMAVDLFEHILEGNSFINNDASLAGQYSRWLPRGIPATCKVSNWGEIDKCASLLTKYTGNCQYGNKDRDDFAKSAYPCEDGLFVKWPMNRCVQFNSCTTTTCTPSVDDVFPISAPPEDTILSYATPKQIEWTTCPTSAPSASPSPIPTPLPSLSPSSAPSFVPTFPPSAHPSRRQSASIITLDTGTGTTSTTCNVKIELHVVDQTKTKCNGDRDGKASCKVFLSDNMDIAIIATPSSYTPKMSDEYFDSANQRSTLPVDCISHPTAADGSYLAVACGMFNGERICASKKVNSGGETVIKFMELTKKDSSIKMLGASIVQAKGPKRRRALRSLQEEATAESTLSVVYPQSFHWDSSTEYYPMIFTSAETWTIDACLYIPAGHILSAVFDAESAAPLPINGECTHVLVPGEELVLLFQATSEPLLSRLRKRERRLLPFLADNDIFDHEIHGHITAALDNSAVASAIQTLNFDTAEN